MPRTGGVTAERALYLVVALLWAYAVVTAVEPLGGDGPHARREMRGFLLPLLAAVPVLALCASTPRTTSVGYLARWFGLLGVLVSGLTVFPVGGFLGLWMIGVVREAVSGFGMLLFLVALLALGIAFVVLLKSVLRPSP